MLQRTEITASESHKNARLQPLSESAEKSPNGIKCYIY